jgi:rhodanese-related sulfurtransferase
VTAHKHHSPGFLAIVDDAKTRIREVSVEETVKRVNGGDARLIDVREDHEWSACRARGAEHMSRGIIERDIEKTIPDKDAEIILYCGGGYRAALAADSLQKMGYTNVASMTGGWRAWLEANAPVDEESK